MIIIIVQVWQILFPRILCENSNLGDIALGLGNNDGSGDQHIYRPSKMLK